MEQGSTSRFRFKVNTTHLNAVLKARRRIPESLLIKKRIESFYNTINSKK
jgi:hypothetical protein